MRNMFWYHRSLPISSKHLPTLLIIVKQRTRIPERLAEAHTHALYFLQRYTQFANQSLHTNALSTSSFAFPFPISSLSVHT